MLTKIIYFLLISVSIINPQTLDNARAEKFIQALLDNEKTLSSFLSPDELAVSNRLGISYEGAANKFLISYEIDSAIAEEIKSGKFRYTYSVHNLEKDYSLLQISVPQKNYIREFYFKNGMMVSPPSYFASHWKTFDNGYFKFFISDTTLFNSYCAEALNEFVEETAKTLNYTEKDLELLKREKIFYYLCANEEEIKQLTGYAALGMYNLAYDYIITTYTCHYHELVHLLMNYKLKNIPLYTSPFLQEGIAVALGGRGGKAPGVILDMGAFLTNAGMLDYSFLLEKNRFQQMDASMSYAVSGLYNLFLLQILGADNYLKLYRKYSGRNNEELDIIEKDLPEQQSWKEFASQYKSPSLIIPNSPFDKEKQKIFARKFKIYEQGEYYVFQSKDTALINITFQFKDYRSRIYNEIRPGAVYNGEHYLITANESEISLYDLFANELIAKFVSSFTTESITANSANGYFTFAVKKDVFKYLL